MDEMAEPRGLRGYLAGQNDGPGGEAISPSWEADDDAREGRSIVENDAIVAEHRDDEAGR
jgi:hypothetical protein